MSKKWKDTTKGGFKIIALYPGPGGCFVGFIETSPFSSKARRWFRSGHDQDAEDDFFDLVPVEPVVYEQTFQIQTPFEQLSVLVKYVDGKRESVEVVR